MSIINNQFNVFEAVFSVVSFRSTVSCIYLLFFTILDFNLYCEFITTVYRCVGLQSQTVDSRSSSMSPVDLQGHIYGMSSTLLLLNWLKSCSFTFLVCTEAFLPSSPHTDSRPFSSHRSVCLRPIVVSSPMVKVIQIRRVMSAFLFYSNNEH